MFWKKKKVDRNRAETVLGMIMLNDECSFDLGGFLSDIKKNFAFKIDNSTGDNNSLVFTVNDEQVLIGHVAAPIPKGDIKQTASYAYNWMTAEQDLQFHKSHLAVAVSKGSHNQLERFKIFTQIICALLRNTNSIGVYFGTQTLLIPKDDYIQEASYMNDDYLPVKLWIYIGLRISASGNSGYTYGLALFNKTELEIINSTKDISDINIALQNLSAYVIKGNIIFKQGETCGFSENEKIDIILSKGENIEGNSFKLLYQ